MLGMTQNGIRTRLLMYYLQGYLWRRRVPWKRECDYAYRYLKPHGIRTLAEMARRVKIREITGIWVPLNRKKPIPYDVLKLYREIIAGKSQGLTDTSIIQPTLLMSEINQYGAALNHTENH
jgi:hypothetical protein